MVGVDGLVGLVGLVELVELVGLVWRKKPNVNPPKKKKKLWYN